MLFELKEVEEHKNCTIEARGGWGIRIVFPVFTYLIRAAGDRQEEKTGPKSDLIEVYL